MSLMSEDHLFANLPRPRTVLCHRLSLRSSPPTSSNEQRDGIFALAGPLLHFFVLLQTSRGVGGSRAAAVYCHKSSAFIVDLERRHVRYSATQERLALSGGNVCNWKLV